MSDETNTTTAPENQQAAQSTDVTAAQAPATAAPTQANAAEAKAAQKKPQQRATAKPKIVASNTNETRQIPEDELTPDQLAAKEADEKRNAAIVDFLNTQHPEDIRWNHQGEIFSLRDLLEYVIR